MNLPLKWIKDENGKIVGYHKYTVAEIIAEKEAKLLEMYEELQQLKNNK